VITFIKGERWSYAVTVFLHALMEKFGEGLSAFIALREQEQVVYDSNVLVVLRDLSLESIREVIRIKREVEKLFRGEVIISPYIAKEGEEENVVEAFIKSASEPKGEEREALKLFEGKVKSLPSVSKVVLPKDWVYDSNVLVVLRDLSLESIREVIRIKREVEKLFRGEVIISPYIAKEGEEENVVEAFEGTIGRGQD